MKSLFLSHMRLLFILILLFFGLNISAQHPYYYTLNDENGLPSNEVYQVIQDDFGFIWIGCDAGLFRYDGFNFNAYTNSKQNSKSISNLKKDSKGNIWCQNFTGQIFRVKADSLELFYDASKETRHYPSYTLDLKNNVWIANDQSILVLSENAKIIKEINNEILHTSGIIFNDIEFSPWKKIYVGTNKNSYVEINPDNFTSQIFDFRSEFTMKNNFLILDNKFFIFKETNPVRKYILSEIQPGKGEIHELALPLKDGGFNYSISSLNSYFLLCNSDGIYVLNKNAEKVNHFPPLFEGQKISSSYLDKEGNLWVTSLQEGIYIIPNFEIGVVNKSNSILADNNISALYQSDDGEIFIGTYSGLLYQYLPEENKLQLLKENPENKYRAVRSIYKSKNEIYFARGLFSILIDGTEKFIPELNNCRDFIKVENKIYFITTDRMGFYDLDSKSKTILREKGGRKMAYNSIENEIYFGCDDGLFIYKNKKIKEIKNENKSIYVSDLSIENEILWIATHQHEVFEFKNQKLRFREEFNDNKSGGIKSLLVKNNYLIYSDVNGLTIYSLKTETKKNINYYDGLAVHEINNILLYKNKIFLATLKGIVIVPFDIKVKNTTPPNILILSIKSDREFVENPKEISIEYGNQNLKINFISTALRSRGKFHYKYRINNFSEEWVEISSNLPEINIPFLPSGDYIFEVIAVNEDGISSKETAKITIHVTAPYWEKWWFYTLLFLLGSGIVGLIFIFRIRYLKQKASAKNKVLLSQLTALKAQMNPHFLFNTLNSIQALILEKDIKSANYYLSRFSTLTRKILSASDSNLISLEEEISILELYLEMEKLRFGDEFSFEIKNEADDYFKIPSMIIQPYVENALKHGLLHKKGEKKLIISFTKIKNELVCKIEDNGIGREKALEIKNRQRKQHSSFATNAIEKRISLLNETRTKKIELEIQDKKVNGTACGTTIIIRIPYDS